MKCVITGVNIKVFARSIHSLARIGDELYVKPGVEGVSFCTVNSSRSAFASFQFGRSFFSQCESVVDSNASQSSSSQPDPDALECKVAMRAFLGAFKSLSSVEKTVERCKIVVDNDAAKVVVQLVCRYSVVRNYHLPFIECDMLRAVYDETSLPCAVTAPSRLLSDVVVNFQPGQDEVSFKVTPTLASMRNYVDDEPDLTKVVRTELKLESDEFDAYDVQAEGEVVFNLKELRAILGFSEPCNLPVTARFSQPGSPIIFSVDNKPMFESKFVLATLPAAQAVESQAGVAGCAAATTSNNSAPNQTSHTLDRSGHHVVEHHVHAEPSASKTSNQKTGDLCQSSQRSIHEMDDVNDDVPLAARIPEALAHSATTDVPPHLTYGHSTLRNGGHSLRNSPGHSISPVHESNLRERSANHEGEYNGSFSEEIEAGRKNWEVLDRIDLDKVGVPFENDCPSPEVVNGIPSPPAKKRRKHFLFNRCFNSTYNPHDISSNNDILAPDSDPEN